MKTFVRYLLLFFYLYGNIYGAQGLADLTTVEEVKNNDQIIAHAVQSVYLTTQNDFNKEIASFTDTLTKVITQLGEYSDVAAQEFNARCDKELKLAIDRINKISAHSSQAYYDELKKAGISYTVGVTDPIAQKLEFDVNSIEGDMISEMRASVAILESKDALPTIGQEIKVGVDTYQQIASQEYAAVQADVMNVPKTSWWQDLKASGTEFLGDVQVNLEKECKIAFVDATDKALKDVTKEASKQAESYAKSLVK